jgi:hypothetical protein
MLAACGQGPYNNMKSGELRNRFACVRRRMRFLSLVLLLAQTDTYGPIEDAEAKIGSDYTSDCDLR